MISSPAGNVRNVVPRWRSLKRTIEARELSFPAPLGTFRKTPGLSAEFRIRLETWRLERNSISAAELVEIAIVEGEVPEAIAAARALLGKYLTPTPFVRDQARRLLERRGQVEPASSQTSGNLEKRLRFWRHRTRSYPADALAWVELARLQFALGSQDDAKRSMLVARQIAPTNRHVIRSAARMFLHLHRPDIAHDFIRRCDATRFDPWLTAAEIAIASHREKPSQFMKNGISLIESENWRPHQINELAAAVGTVFFKDGNRKRGKKMMMRGLADPTGNTLAQAEWIKEALHETFAEPTLLGTSSDANEANALRLFRIGDFAKSLEWASLWIGEEPFSNRAYVFGVAAASAGQDYEQALRLAERGLRYDPHSYPILHNKVFALACSGRTDEAERILERIPHDGGDLTHVAEANRGLIAFRRGLPDIGIPQYRLAIAGFRNSGDLGNEQIAMAYLAREAVRANDPQAKAFVDEAESKIESASAPPQAKKVLNDAKLMLQIQSLRQIGGLART